MSLPRVTDRPPSVKEITAAAERINWNPNLLFQHWARSTNTLYQEAVFAARENDYRRAYFHLFRYSKLVIDLLPSHPAAKLPENRKLYRPLTKTLPEAIALMDEIKPHLDRAHQAWLEEESARKVEEPRDQKQMVRDILDLSNRVDVPVLDASQNVNLAVRLAQEAQTRRISKRGRVERYGADGQVWKETDEETFRRQMESSRRTLEGFRVQKAEETVTRSEGVAYPEVGRAVPFSYTPVLEPVKPPSAVPSRPPKTGNQLPEYPTPAIPSKTPLATPELPFRPPKISETPAPAAPTFIFAPAAHLESGEPLRPMFLPSGLRKAFLSLSRANTVRKIETCGMLCGAPQNGALYVHELLVPEQMGKEDVCETTNELAIFEHLESSGLVCFGWIHTHPTQSCFMSSRDLHTHAGYQGGLPEAVAIVCAPSSEPSYGIFRLTDPPGKDHILECRQTATFHQHSIDNLYTRCDKPAGHVIEQDDLTFTVVDQRK